MKIYVEKEPETIGITTSEDDVNLKEVRMWIRTDENIEIKNIEKYIDNNIGKIKVFANKNKETGKYLTYSGEYTDELFQAETFDDYETAKFYCPSTCEIVECILVEQNKFIQYKKKLLEENFNKLAEMLSIRAELVGKDNYAEFMFTVYDLTESIKEILEEMK